MLPEPKRRIRWLTREEADLPGHLAAMARFSLETGLRRSNVTGLLWSQVDLTRRTAWVHADQAKARKAIAVPLSAAAVVVIREQIGKHSTHVFSFRGKPVRQVNTKAWHLALKRVGIEDFRWHDLRHTWASWHVQGGTPLYVLQELRAGSAWTWFGSTRISPAIISCITSTACPAYASCRTGKWLRFRLQRPNEKGLQCLQALD